MEQSSILEPLEFLKAGEFPRQALLAAVAQRERITPALLEILEKARKNVQDLARQESYMAHIYALYLLAQFRETRAYPLIVDFFSIPGEVTLDVTGDLVTEDLCRILASVSGGDPGPIKTLVENRQANEYVRSAALEALLVLVAQGEQSREEVVGYYQHLLQGGLEREPSQGWNGLVCCCCDLHPEEVAADLRQAFQEDLVEEWIVGFDSVLDALSTNKGTVLRRLKQNERYQYIDDVISEMEWWACFRQ
ncbi:MAG: DUF1186 domain-containing protein [Chloroflexia bacterium]|nr:DUF1186 domain-containing protein [Chloroflexia bacterium]